MGDAALRGGVAPVRDRLISMLLLAALLHGILILGITFGRIGGTGDSAPAMEVLLVGDDVPAARDNADAAYLAQRTQLGSGNTTVAVAAELPSLRRAGDSGSANAVVQIARAAAQAREAGDGLLASWGAGTRLTYLAPPESAIAPETPPPGEAADDSAGRGRGEAVTLRGRTRAELYVTADTRESRLAPYLDAWRQRVERIGTLNYPSAAQRLGLQGSPVVEVIIRADGALQSARVRRSSGHPEIDAAALQILRLASPFDPFPADLSVTYGTLRFAYEWQFVGGRLTRGSVSVP